MIYRPLGRTGVMVSNLCLGVMNFGGATPDDEAFAILDRALDAGINLIDTADGYNSGDSERVLGQGLKRNRQRDSVLVATKVNSPTGKKGINDRGLSRYHIIKACEDSLRRLGTDRIDLYQLHLPSLTIPQEETLRALDDLVGAGKVIYIGCSNFPAWMIMEGISTSERLNLVRYASEQPPYNLIDRRIENEIVPICQKYGVSLLPWSPVAGGILTGRYNANNAGGIPENSRAQRSGETFQERVTKHSLQVAEAVGRMAKERGLTSAQLALLWCKDQPGVTAPVFGPRTVSHLDDALGIADKTLDETDRPLFDELVHPGTAVSDFRNNSSWMKALAG